MKKIKVLLISHAYVEPDNLQKVISLSAFEDLEVGVLFPRQWVTWHGEEKRSSNKAIELSSSQIFSLPVYFSGDSGLYFYNPWELRKVIKSFNPDVIHLEEEPWTPVAGETAYFAGRRKKKLVFFSWENLNVPQNFWRRRIEQYVFDRASLAAGGSRGAVERLRRQGFSGPVEILPQFGVDTNKFKIENLKFKIEEKRRALGLEGFVVGFAGRLAPEKGLETLLRAAAKLNDNWSLLLLSTTSELPSYFRKLATELGIRDKLKLATGVPHNDFPDYLVCMDVCVLPSLTTPTWAEQFGRVLVEAMACGVPVIGSSSGTIPEVVDGAGLIFREGDAEDLAEKIRALRQDNNLRQKYQIAGRMRMEQNYSMRVIAERTRDLFKSLL